MVAFHLSSWASTRLDRLDPTFLQWLRPSLPLNPTPTWPPSTWGHIILWLFQFIVSSLHYEILLPRNLINPNLCVSLEGRFGYLVLCVWRVFIVCILEPAWQSAVSPVPVLALVLQLCLALLFLFAPSASKNVSMERDGHVNSADWKRYMQPVSMYSKCPVTLSISSSKSTFSQPFHEKWICEVMRIGSIIIFPPMNSQVLHCVVMLAGFTLLMYFISSSDLHILLKIDIIVLTYQTVKLWLDTCNFTIFWKIYYIRCKYYSLSTVFSVIIKKYIFTCPTFSSEWLNDYLKRYTVNSL